MTRSEHRDPERSAFERAHEKMDRAFRRAEEELDRAFAHHGRRRRRHARKAAAGPKSRSRLYRDPENGKVMGWFIPLVPAYFIAGFLLEPKPEDLYEDAEEEEFWRSVRRAPDYTTQDLKRKLAAVDRRIQEMEAYLTSKRFRLDRELKGLEG